MKSKILVVDDDLEFNSLMVEALVDEGYDVKSVLRLKDAGERLLRENFDCVLLDVMLPDGNGLEMIEPALSSGACVIVMSAYGNVTSAVEAVKKGAFNFLEKPFELNHALFEIQRAIEYSNLSTDNARLKKERHGHISNFIGQTEPIRKIKNLVKIIAFKKVTILIESESGTGKEIIARSIHELSGRKNFVAINCGAIPETLFESELFGYEKGAFTGAQKAKKGLIEEADRGTLFLDEIGELPLSMQTKLLRFLESGTFKRIGATVPKLTDVRVVCATNKNLKTMVTEGKFREDLFYRLNVVKVNIPPLRERKEDIPLIIKEISKDLTFEIGLRKVPELSTELMEKLVNYSWPGNVRELRNLLLSLFAIHGNGEIIGVDSLPPNIHEVPVEESAVPEQDMSLNELERNYTEKLLKRHAGNKTKVAKILGISKSTLYEKLKKWQLEE